MRKMTEQASGHGQITKIWLSDRRGGNTVPMVVDMGKDGVDLNVI